jgi:hypothetical protein
VDHTVRTFDNRLGRAFVRTSCLLVLICLVPEMLKAQTPDRGAEMERPVPILTGNAGFFTNVNGGRSSVPHRSCASAAETAGWWNLG